MAMSPKSIRTQMAMLKPLLKSCSLETMRRGQNMIGDLMGVAKAGRYVTKNHSFENFDGIWIVPKEERRQGVILYLHGGGYTCGGTDYAKVFGVTLADHFGVKVFCPGYRLAPENPFPAALEDVMESYRYLLSKGYEPEHIMLCGESAGGGLCYSLCLQLKILKMKMPCGIVAISPWVDLTLSGESYMQNIHSDPSLTLDYLQYCAQSYTNDPSSVLASPIFGDLTGFPPSLIFAAEEELLLSDSKLLHEKLTSVGCISQLKVKKERWHAYVVYGVAEDSDDLTEMNRFFNRYLSREKMLRWMRLDNAAKLFSSVRNQNWSNVFRLSMTLDEEIDRQIMQSALDVTVRRFPSIAVRIRRGIFWHYLQQLEQAPTIRDELSYPLAKMSYREARRCAFRVIVYQNRVAVEFFHSLTDGNGGLIFLKSLVAEYLEQKYGIVIPLTDGVLGRLEEPNDAEMEDSFLKHAGPVSAKKKEATAWQLKGTPEYDGFVNLTCFEMSVQEIRNKAREYGVTVTAFLCAVLMQALQQLQKQHVPNIRRRKPIKVYLPINLRNMFDSNTLRNFILYTMPQLDTRLGEYEFSEICRLVHHWIGLDATPRKMAMLIASNVNSEKSLFVKLIPLFLKNIILRVIFFVNGERKSCLSLSNLGIVSAPDPMRDYIKHFDFVMGVKATSPYNCGVISYGDKLRVNFVRKTQEPQLEMAFFRVLQDLGITVEVSSNGA